MTRLSRVFTRRNNTAVIVLMAVVGLVLVFTIRDPRTATYVFVTVTAVQGWTFTVIYGCVSTWRATSASRALFWIIAAYTLVATHVFINGILHFKPTWSDDLRQMLYLGLAVAGMNLILTMVRLVASSDAP